MTDLVPSRPSFSTGVKFIEWMQANAEPSLTQVLPQQSSEFLIEFQGLFEQCADVRGDYSMLKLSGTLGKSIPQFMGLANKARGFTSNSEQRAFVLSSAIALYRLIDRGVSGTEQNIGQGSDGDLPPLFDDSLSMEDMLVRPLAEQAFDQSSQFLKDLGS